MLNLMKFANAVYNKYRYDIPSSVTKFDFYRTKFWYDQIKTRELCNLLYKKLY